MKSFISNFLPDPLVWFCGLVTVAGMVQSRGAEINAAPAAYKMVHGWPVLPENFMLGHVSGAGVDSHNHVFVFHRGSHSVLSTNFTTAVNEPLVLCFDGKTGRQVSAWGEKLFYSPHGLRVDEHDNVWVTDIGRHQVLKFSHEGKLLLELGEKGVSGWDAGHLNK